MGLFGPDHQIIDHSSKLIPLGVAVFIFEMRRLEKLKMLTFFVLLETMEMQKGAQLCTRKDVFRHKSDFFRVLLDSIIIDL